MDAHAIVMPQAVPKAPPPPFRPRGRVSLTKFIVDRNPFYLLSAVMMFAGVRVILSALEVKPGDLKSLLVLIGVLNTYEALVIGLALFLITRRGLLRDGWLLLSIEALFLVDFTFLNAELFTANLRWGAWINAMSFALALIKIAVVVRTLRLQFTAPEWLCVTAQLLAIFLMAGAFKEISNHNHQQQGALSAMVIYGAWWLVGIALAAATPLLANPYERRQSGSPMWALPARLYLLVPFCSLLVHLAGVNRVYWVHFHVANLAPLLLGAAVALSRWRVEMRRKTLVGWQCALCSLAVLLSLSTPDALMLDLHRFTVSPLRLTLIASAAVMVLSFFQSRYVLTLPLAGGQLFAALLGNSIDEMEMTLHRSGHATMDNVRNLGPETPMQWGVLAVIASFLLLGVGAWISLKKRPDDGG
jgi:hypothetical protein